ncbi:DUF927 domain-containing protein [Moraxellaceae bacterium AER2_44_116]|nr:DUF927 domain-containing protein [Moraxellaceae bacterium AER2_44_116]
MSSFEHIADFKQTISSTGITLPETIIVDGQIHRYGNKKNCWYVFHEGDVSGGAFGCWKTGITQTWCSKQASEFNQAERESWIKQQAEIAAKVKAETLAKQAEAAKKGIYLWGIARSDVDLKHAYLATKGIYPHGVKQLGQALLIPVYGQDKQLTGCQFIYPTGDKRFITGTKKKGSFHCLKPLNFNPEQVPVIYITEGYATGVSVFMAMQELVFIAFDKGNLKAVAMFVRSKYPQALIVICGDNDADGGGQQAAIEAAQAVNGYVALPELKDWNDQQQKDGLEAVKKMIDAAIDSKKAAPSSEESAAANTPPVSSSDSVSESTTQANQAKEDTQKGTYFFLNEDNTVAEKRGVYFVGISKEGKYLPPMQVCGVLKIKAITRNQDHQEHGFLLEWLDRDNYKHYWSMPAELFKGDGADYRGQLLGCGLYIAPTATARMRLAEYIQNHHTPDRALCVDKTGWYQQLFITPNRTYGKQSENEVVIYQSSQSFINGYRQRGTLDEWRDKVAVLCVGNSRLVFSVCVAFAGSLLRLGHEESGGFHLRGNSSVGKSTGQHLACSVWGSRDYKQTWRATINGLEGIAALYNDGLLVLDEMAQADPKAIGETVYMLGNEQGKIRSQKSLIPRKNLSWKLLFLSSGELSLEQMMRDGGKKTKAGQEVRLVDIAADAGKRMGMVESLNGYPSAKELMDTLNRRTSQYYGVAGHTFLGAITQQPDEISQFLKDFKQRFIKANVQQGASEQVLRVASRFALVAAAGEMATNEGITGWPKGEAYKAVVSCFNAWLEGRGGTGNQEVQAIKSQVRAFFEAHGESRFADWDDNPLTLRTVINRAGFRKKHHDGDVYAVLPEAYSKEICAGFDVKNVNRVLLEAGWITPDKEGKAAQRPSLPSMGQTRAYVFTTSMWQDD